VETQGRDPVRAILDGATRRTPEEIAGPDIYPGLAVEAVRRILAYVTLPLPLDPYLVVRGP
jgi:hypothetical protein